MLSFAEYQHPNIDKEIEQTAFYTKEGKDAIVKAHLKLVISISQQYRNIQARNISYEDIVQEGILGLYGALNKFDPEKYVRFSTFARPYIQNAIRQYLRRNSHLLFIPQKKLWQIYGIKRALKRNPRTTNAEIAKSLGIKEKSVVSLLPYIDIDQCYTSINRSYQAVIIEESSVLSDKIKSILNDLPDQDRQILNMREIQGMSLREVGNELGISHEAVRNKYNKIISRIRKESGASE